ncbi:SRPBCC domain-containing protein [Brachybacterium sp. DNPG3]
MVPTRSLSVIDAVRRRLHIDDTGDPVTARLSLSTNIGLAPARLWPLLTTVEGLATWYGPVTGALREGGSLALADGTRAHVLEVASPHRIALAWDRGHGEEPLLIRVDPEDDGTAALRIVHELTMPRAVFEERGPGAVAVGWEVALLRLAAATDGWRATCMADVPHPEPAWLSTPDGAEHLRAWAVRWAAEQLAAGVDEEAVRRGEEATVAALGRI